MDLRRETCGRSSNKGQKMNEALDNNQLEIQKTLGIDGPASRTRRLIPWMMAVIGVSVAGMMFFVWKGNHENNNIRYHTQKVQRGDLTITVTATGNLAPTNQVEIGSELSGIIDAVYVDDNDRVTAGQVLAKLDTTKLNAEVLQAKAALASARAKTLQTRATVAEARNQFKRLQEAWQISQGQAVSLQDLDAAQAALDRALADQASAQAGVDQAKAVLEAAQTNLSKAAIVSPFDGIVLSRSAEPGQTVAASLQAPVLFKLAQDLTHMELHADVDEADVAQVQEGQQATFTVDAYPNRTFPATITQVRYDSKTVEGVVTYETILAVDNSDLALRPGMTATADIIVDQIQNALLVPNAALRFSPPEKPKQTSEGRSLVSMLLPRPPSISKKKAETFSKTNPSQVWVLQKGKPTAISVTVGKTDGAMTEIKQGDISQGMDVIVSAVSDKK